MREGPVLITPRDVFRVAYQLALFVACLSVSFTIFGMVNFPESYGRVAARFMTAYYAAITTAEGAKSS